MDRTAFRKNFISRPHPIIVGAIFVVASFLFFYAFQTDSPAEEDGLMEGIVVRILSERETTQQVGFEENVPVTEQNLLVELNHPDGSMRVEALNDYVPLREGSKAYFQESLFEEQESEYVVAEVKRHTGLGWIALLFFIFVFIVSGFQGLRSTVGLFFSLAIIFAVMVPLILGGANPILAGAGGGFAILLVGLYAAYGFNRKSISALTGISITLLVVGTLAAAAVNRLYLTGFGSEGASYLPMAFRGGGDLVDLLIAGIIIAAIGVLDDVAVAQASTVFALKKENAALKSAALFRRAMSVGRDHIASVINTLVLAYTGAALPLILLFSVTDAGAGLFLSNEIVAEEIARTLVASFGLVLAVPLTTAIAVFLADKQKT